MSAQKLCQTSECGAITYELFTSLRITADAQAQTS